MRAWLLLAALSMALAGPLTCAAQAAPEPGCLIVYGHGRNVGEPAQNEAWDQINARFNAAVTERLRAAGLAAQPLVLKVGPTDLAAAVQILIARAGALGCSRVVDTAVLADDKGALVVRLRVHPLLGQLGPVAAPSGPLRIGAALFTSQREFDLNARTLERLNLEAQAGAMVEDYLRPPAAAASPSPPPAAPPAAPASAAGRR